MFYSFFYCTAYYVVAKKYFPYYYAGYFVLCVVGCMGFVSYGSNTIRAGFGIALLLIAFCVKNRMIKACLSIAAIGCQMSMLLPVAGYLASVYIIKKERWCEYIWVIFLLITSMTSVISDVMTMFGALDARIEEMADYDGTSEVYNVGFRWDFLIYSAIPILIARFNIRSLLDDNSVYLIVYRSYLLSNAVWLLIMRIPFSDRVAYLSWFMIPFLLLYPVLNGKLNIQRPQRYVLLTIAMYAFVNMVLTLK